MLFNVTVAADLAEKNALRRMPLVRKLLNSSPAEIEAEVRSRVTNQAEAVDMLVHLSKLVAMLLKAEAERRKR